MDRAIDLSKKFAMFSSHWSPHIVGQLNDFHVKIVKCDGAFVWHKHDETDEMFLVHDGHLTIELRDGDVELTTGGMYIVPKGVEHRPVAHGECKIVLIEPAGTVNTGDAEASAMTASGEPWI